MSIPLNGLNDVPFDEDPGCEIDKNSVHAL